jgi:hypothetical protein
MRGGKMIQAWISVRRKAKYFVHIKIINLDILPQGIGELNAKRGIGPLLFVQKEATSSGRLAN